MSETCRPYRFPQSRLEYATTTTTTARHGFDDHPSLDPPPPSQPSSLRKKVLMKTKKKKKKKRRAESATRTPLAAAPTRAEAPRQQRNTTPVCPLEKTRQRKTPLWFPLEKKRAAVAPSPPLATPPSSPRPPPPPSPPAPAPSSLHRRRGASTRGGIRSGLAHHACPAFGCGVLLVVGWWWIQNRRAAWEWCPCLHRWPWNRKRQPPLHVSVCRCHR